MLIRFVLLPSCEKKLSRSHRLHRVHPQTEGAPTTSVRTAPKISYPRARLAGRCLRSIVPVFGHDMPHAVRGPRCRASMLRLDADGQEGSSPAMSDGRPDRIGSTLTTRGRGRLASDFVAGTGQGDADEGQDAPIPAAARVAPQGQLSGLQRINPGQD